MLILLVLLLSVAALSVVVYKQDIIKLLTDEVNAHIKTKLEVGNIDLKLLQGLPYISVAFTDVKFHSAFKDELLLTSQTLYFNLNVRSLFNKGVQIERLEVHNAELFIHYSKEGKPNFDVFVVNKKDSLNDEKGDLILTSVLFKNVTIRNKDDLKKIDATYKIEELKGSAIAEKTNLKLDVKTNFRLQKTNMEGEKWLLHRNIYVATKLTVAPTLITIGQSTIGVEYAKFGVQGNIVRGSKTKLDILFTGKKIKFHHLVSILPAAWQQYAAPLKGKGEIDLDATIKGYFSGKLWPGLQAKISLKDFELHHARLSYPMQHINVQGSVQMKKLWDLSSAQFALKKLEAKVNNHPVAITGALTNFKKPIINLAAQGTLDASWLFNLLAPKLVANSNASGTLQVNLNTGLTSLPKGGFAPINARGDVAFDSVSVSNFNGLPLNNLSGELSFGNNALNFKSLNVSYGQTQLVLNGQLQRSEQNETLSAYKASVRVESPQVNLDEIINVVAAPKDSTATKPKTNNHKILYTVNLDLQVDNLNFMKFKGRDIRARLQLKNNEVDVLKATFTGLGGRNAVSGKVLQQFNNDYYIEANAHTEQIYLDSLFYVFGNFGQNFITDKAIKGLLNANVFTKVYFSSRWNIHRNLLYTEALLNVKKGELNNFEPIMSLSDYLINEDENLAKLRFSEIENSILIKNDTVFIADMNVGTNVRNIKIGGYHTLNQQIDYRLAVPIIKESLIKESEFGNVRKDEKGGLYMPFRIKGTTDNYRVSYDLKTAGSNFITGLKNELKGIGHVLTGKPVDNQSNDTLKLEEEEYFDWEDN